MFVWGCMVTAVVDMCKFSRKSSEAPSTLMGYIMLPTQWRQMDTVLDSQTEQQMMYCSFVLSGLK